MLLSPTLWLGLDLGLLEGQLLLLLAVVVIMLLALALALPEVNWSRARVALASSAWLLGETSGATLSLLRFERTDQLILAR